MKTYIFKMITSIMFMYFQLTSGTPHSWWWIILFGLVDCGIWDSIRGKK